MKFQKKISTICTSETFKIAKNILETKPHVVNKRIWGCTILARWICKTDFPSWEYPKSCPYLKCCNKIDDYVVTLCKDINITICNTLENSGVEMVLVDIFPKTFSTNHVYQLVLFKKNEDSVTFYDITPKEHCQNVIPNFPYTLQLYNNDIILIAECGDDDKSYEWLKQNVLPQFIKWMEENSSQLKHNKLCSDSLGLVSKCRYYDKYNELKLKYGKDMVKIWPECTDPSKFVYEDVAIATYLLLLWEEQKLSNKQSFVDLGCGNGLLVYILTMEGHTGIGIDVRKRNIWDLYPAEIQLKEATIRPDDTNLFQETEWIIGNHSDELTPWIPVIAARSSYNCNYFLLPCCAYNFDGTKYQRKNSSKSQYTEYLEYITHVSDECGFVTEIDRLKIPSTKRICLVGRTRTYSQDKYISKINCIQEFINNESNSNICKDENSSWVENFKARETVEKVKNCTQVDKNIIDKIVMIITNYLLEGCNSSNEWFSGKSVNIHELIKLIPTEKLKALKSECGGLQTLLKNNHHIFKVCGGKVELRTPKSIEEIKKSGKFSGSVTMKLQLKPCWFHSHHPQGCPLEDSNCSFLHKR